MSGTPMDPVVVVQLAQIQRGLAVLYDRLAEDLSGEGLDAGDEVAQEIEVLIDGTRVMVARVTVVLSVPLTQRELQVELGEAKEATDA